MRLARVEKQDARACPARADAAADEFVERFGCRDSASGGTGTGAGNRSVIRLPGEEQLFDVA